jgi:dolichyl-phosphate beta-glucosyltransferase
MEQKLLLIIPFYNEAERMAQPELAAAFTAHPNCDFLLVNDGSTDGTPIVLDDFSTRYENVKTVHLPQNAGKAEAIRYAVWHTETEHYRHIGYMDADLATPTAELMRMQHYVNEHPHYTFIMGSRIKRLGSNITRYAKRHYFGRVFATIVSKFILKAAVYDTQCGAKVIEKDLALQLFEKPFITRWIFDVELLLRYKKRCGNFNGVYEYSLSTWTEQGHSKITFKDLLGFPLQLIKIYRAYV